ncbi:serine acetyltransferase [Clostridium perfringens]|uniref:serine O-acetyltransferase n=1 Tax=Clostridium perfringens TaxID=1502 RepID=UPI0018E4A10F|nr:serine acetyltransferase [Clostridium perfringens]MBI6077502.1 serine acetyltransferase [Clostridium perfringens]
MRFKILRYLLEYNRNAVKLCYICSNNKDKKYSIKSLLAKRKLAKKYGIHLGLNTKIEQGIKLPHPTSIVIGEGVEIGSNCTIYQNVTIGKKRGNLDTEYDYPKLMNGVTVFPGACIIGDIVIGENSIIAANSVVVNGNVEANTIYGGVPAKCIGYINKNRME